MKLNYKKTLFVGFAFFLICLFWQAYDTLIPKILVNKFGMNQTWSGLIMALDNLFALFLLPIFGSLSDKTKTRFGKRTPYIIVGTVLSCVFFFGLSVADNMKLSSVEYLTPQSEISAELMDELWEECKTERIVEQGGKKHPLYTVISEQDFKAIKAFTDETGATFTDDYVKYVIPARQHVAWQNTLQSPATLVFFVTMLLLLLVSMSTFRSPAVALMPDVTLPPLRSKANAVINLMGAAGGALVLVLGIILGTGQAKNSMMSYMGVFGICIIIMLACLVAFLFTVKEKKWAEECEAEKLQYGIEESKEDANEGSRKLSKGEFVSLILILLSVVFWYAGYNAVTSKYSVYAEQVLSVDYSTTLLIATAAAIVSYLPVGLIASRIGRKKTVIAGVVMLAVAFAAAAFMQKGTHVMVMNGLFVLAGVGWATINVNSYPMVVELAKGSTVGKFTGYYYTASMAAQAATPFLSGLLMDGFGMWTLFPYAAVFVALALVTMAFVRHGDSKPPKQVSALESLAEMDV